MYHFVLVIYCLCSLLVKVALILCSVCTLLTRLACLDSSSSMKNDSPMVSPSCYTGYKSCSLCIFSDLWVLCSPSVMSCTQWARFLTHTFLMHMVILLHLKHSFHNADRLSNFRFSLEQLLSGLWANFNCCFLHNPTHALCYTLKYTLTVKIPTEILKSCL